MHRGRGGVRLVSMYESLLISFKQHKHICLDEISREKRGLIWEDVHTNTICVKPLRCRLETRRAQSDVLSYAQSLKVTFHQKIMQCICGTWLDVKVKLTKLKWSATFQILMLFIIFFLKAILIHIFLLAHCLKRLLFLILTEYFIKKENYVIYHTLVVLKPHDDFLPQSCFFFVKNINFESLPAPVARNILIFKNSPFVLHRTKKVICVWKDEGG